MGWDAESGLNLTFVSRVCGWGRGLLRECNGRIAWVMHGISPGFPASPSEAPFGRTGLAGTNREPFVFSAAIAETEEGIVMGSVTRGGVLRTRLERTLMPVALNRRCQWQRRAMPG